MKQAQTNAPIQLLALWKQPTLQPMKYLRSMGSSTAWKDQQKPAAFRRRPPLPPANLALALALELELALALALALELVLSAPVGVLFPGLPAVGKLPFPSYALQPLL
jgi:hypothetical protein